MTLPKQSKTVLQFVLGLALGAVLVYFAFSNVEIDQLEAKIQEADAGWVVAGVLLSLFSHWLRGFRWRMLLKASGYNVSSTNAFAATMVGYLTNLAIPRLGELTRCFMLARANGVPIVANAGTVVVERVIDVLTLLVLMGVVTIFEFQAILQLLTEIGFLGRLPLLSALGGAALAGLGVVWYFRKRLLASPIGQKISEMLDAVFSIRKMESPVLFVVVTAAIWTCYILITYFVFLSLPETYDFSLYFAMLVTVTGAIGMTLPAPGGFGTYHNAFKLTFVLYGLSGETGLAIALLIHTPGVMMTISAGAVSFAYLWFQKPAVQTKTLEP